VVLALAGLTFTAQGLGLTHSVRSFMNDRPEWIAIGSGLFVLALAGITFTAQGLGLTHSVRSVMNDRPEWVAIGSGLVVLAAVLLWRTTRRRPV